MARILIVDDHIETCRVMTMLVKHLGHEAHALFSGAEVTDFLQQTPVDLMILDIMMPGMSGMDVLRHVRSDPNTKAVPVIMMTAVTDPMTRREAMTLGANDYWVKATIEVAELERRLTKFTGPGGNAEVPRWAGVRSFLATTLLCVDSASSTALQPLAC